jgi:phosphoribosylglycinamide formyltransferase 1
VKNIAIFASGNGTNFSAIARAVKNGRLKVNLALLVCDNPEAKVIGRAKEFGVKVALVRREDFVSKDGFESRIVKHLKEEKIDLIILAGFMRLLSKSLVVKYKGRIINVHPSLLPCFKGGQAIKDAFNYGVRVTGVTVHFVDELMDHGPIILQKEIRVNDSDTLAGLEARIHKIEHKLYPQAIDLFVKGKLRVRGRKVGIISR